MRRKLRSILVLVLSCLLLLGGCSGEKEPDRELLAPILASEPEKAPESSGAEAPKEEPHSSLPEEAPPSSLPEEKPAEKPQTAYIPPHISAAVFHRDLAEQDGDMMIDVSAVAEGYVGVSAKAPSRLKFRVIHEEIVYTYDLPNDGTPTIFGLQSGDGHYSFHIYENVVEKSYAERFSAEAEVTLEDEFQPFLRTNQYAPYDSDSACVKKAAEVAAESATQLEAARAVFEYVCHTITYDKQKAKTVASGYLPVPDDTLREGKGICFDYASLTACMMRSLGIPTKIIFGFVAPENVYHAWNMFYTEETGWVTAEYQEAAGGWNRMDCTFSANGSDPARIGSGVNYTDLYVY